MFLKVEINCVDKNILGGNGLWQPMDLFILSSNRSKYIVPNLYSKSRKHDLKKIKNPMQKSKKNIYNRRSPNQAKQSKSNIKHFFLYYLLHLYNSGCAGPFGLTFGSEAQISNIH